MLEFGQDAESLEHLRLLHRLALMSREAVRSAGPGCGRLLSYLHVFCVYEGGVGFGVPSGERRHAIIGVKAGDGSFTFLFAMVVERSEVLITLYFIDIVGPLPNIAYPRWSFALRK